MHRPAVGQGIIREILDMPGEFFGLWPDIAHGVDLGLAGQDLKADEPRLAKLNRGAFSIDSPGNVVAGSAAGPGV